MEDFVHGSQSDPASRCLSDVSYLPPSRTHEYKKMMKPLMERKRRARMNVCIEEIRDLMSAQISGMVAQRLSRDDDLVSRMDKAEVLEVAVKHIHKQLISSRRVDPYSEVKMFHQGYVSARAIINDFLQTNPCLDGVARQRLNCHLDRLVTPPSINAPTNAPLPAALTPPLLGPPPRLPDLAAPLISLPTPRAVRAPVSHVPAQPTPVRPTVLTSSDDPLNLSKSAFHQVAPTADVADRNRSLSGVSDSSWRPW